MKNYITILLASLIAILILGLFGCGSGGGGGTAAEIPGLVTDAGWYFTNQAPDYSSSGATCDLKLFVYYSPTLTTDDIDTFTLTSANGQRWTATTSKVFGTGANNRPYISGQFYYGANPEVFPVAGIWTVQLKLKNGNTSTLKKTLHEPGSSAVATHPYVYTPEDYTPSTDDSLYIAGLRRFPSQGYVLRYSSADNKLFSTGLASVRSGFLATDPRAYNMFCWLYDADNTYLGYTNREYSTIDRTSSGLIDNGELSLIPAATNGSTGYVDLSKVKYIRFVYIDGSQYAPTSYSSYDWRSISALIPVTAIDGSGASWTQRQAAWSTDDFAGIAWSGTQYVTVGASSGHILTSPDGVTWTRQTSATSNSLHSVAWGGSQFVTVGSAGTILTSPDGVTWTSRNSGTTASLVDVTWAYDRFVAVGNTYNNSTGILDNVILSSTDGANWKSTIAGTHTSLYQVTWSGSMFVAVGGLTGSGFPTSNLLLTSTDGVNWTPRTTNVSNQLLIGVTWSGTQFVAVGTGGTIITSPDGITWILRTSGTVTRLFNVAWSGKNFVAVGSNRTILTSPDGITWTMVPSDYIYSLDLYDVIWSGMGLVAVGEGGSIFTSP